MQRQWGRGMGESACDWKQGKEWGSAAANWEEDGLGRAKQDYENIARKPASL